METSSGSRRAVNQMTGDDAKFKDSDGSQSASTQLYPPESVVSKKDNHVTRPCAVIGPDVIPPYHKSEGYSRVSHIWPQPGDGSASYYRHPQMRLCSERVYPPRNISPRHTFQENMSRIIVPSSKLRNDHYLQPQGGTIMLSDSSKPSIPADAKYCEGAVVGNPHSDAVHSQYDDHHARHGQASPRHDSQGIPHAVPQYAVHGYAATKAQSSAVPQYPSVYNCPEFQRYPIDYQNPGIHIVKGNQMYQKLAEPSSYIMANEYSNTYSRAGNLRYEPYPPIKDKYVARYDYPYQYSSQYPPAPGYSPISKTNDLRKRNLIQSEVKYFPMPQKYMEPHNLIPNGEFRTKMSSRRNQSNMPYHLTDMSAHNMDPYASQNKIYGFNVCDKNNQYNLHPRTYSDHNKLRMDYYSPYRGMPYSENPIAVDNVQNQNCLKSNFSAYPMKPPDVHNAYLPLNNGSYHKSLEDHAPRMNEYDANNQKFYCNQRYVSHNPLAKIPTEFSPNIISPAESSTSFDSSNTVSHQLYQEDGGYVSQCSTTSGKSADYQLGFMKNPTERHGYFAEPADRHNISNFAASTIPNLECDKSTGKSRGMKNSMDLRQFLEMWDEEYEEPRAVKPPPIETSNIAELTTGACSMSATDHSMLPAPPQSEQLYVLDKMTIAVDDLHKYEHIQKVTKLPDNIKDYDQSENLKKKNIKSNRQIIPDVQHFNSKVEKFNSDVKIAHNTQKPICPSPNELIDVEAKISQSIIHKDVACNFDIRPCSPGKMIEMKIDIPCGVSKRSVDVNADKSLSHSSYKQPAKIQPFGYSNGYDNPESIMKSNKRNNMKPVIDYRNIPLNPTSRNIAVQNILPPKQQYSSINQNIGTSFSPNEHRETVLHKIHCNRSPQIEPKPVDFNVLLPSGMNSAFVSEIIPDIVENNMKFTNKYEEVTTRSKPYQENETNLSVKVNLDPAMSTDKVIQLELGNNNVQRVGCEDLPKGIESSVPLMQEKITVFGMNPSLLHMPKTVNDTELVHLETAVETKQSSDASILDEKVSENLEALNLSHSKEEKNEQRPFKEMLPTSSMISEKLNLDTGLLPSSEKCDLEQKAQFVVEESIADAVLLDNSAKTSSVECIYACDQNTYSSHVQKDVKDKHVLNEVVADCKQRIVNVAIFDEDLRAKLIPGMFSDNIVPKNALEGSDFIEQFHTILDGNTEEEPIINSIIGNCSSISQKLDCAGSDSNIAVIENGRGQTDLSDISVIQDLRPILECSSGVNVQSSQSNAIERNLSENNEECNINKHTNINLTSASEDITPGTPTSVSNLDNTIETIGHEDVLQEMENTYLFPKEIPVAMDVSFENEIKTEHIETVSDNEVNNCPETTVFEDGLVTNDVYDDEDVKSEEKSLTQEIISDETVPAILVSSIHSSRTTDDEDKKIDVLVTDAKDTEIKSKNTLNNLDDMFSNSPTINEKIISEANIKCMSPIEVNEEMDNISNDNVECSNISLLHKVESNALGDEISMDLTENQTVTMDIDTHKVNCTDKDLEMKQENEPKNDTKTDEILTIDVCVKALDSPSVNSPIPLAQSNNLDKIIPCLESSMSTNASPASVSNDYNVYEIVDKSETDYEIKSEERIESLSPPIIKISDVTVAVPMIYESNESVSSDMSDKDRISTEVTVPFEKNVCIDTKISLPISIPIDFMKDMTVADTPVEQIVKDIKEMKTNTVIDNLETDASFAIDVSCNQSSESNNGNENILLVDTKHIEGIYKDQDITEDVEHIIIINTTKEENHSPYDKIDCKTEKNIISSSDIYNPENSYPEKIIVSQENCDSILQVQVDEPCVYQTAEESNKSFEDESVSGYKNLNGNEGDVEIDSKIAVIEEEIVISNKIEVSDSSITMPDVFENENQLEQSTHIAFELSSGDTLVLDSGICDDDSKMSDGSLINAVIEVSFLEEHKDMCSSEVDTVIINESENILDDPGLQESTELNTSTENILYEIQGLEKPLCSEISNIATYCEPVPSPLYENNVFEEHSKINGNVVDLGDCWIEDIACEETVISEETIYQSEDEGMFSSVPDISCELDTSENEGSGGVPYSDNDEETKDSNSNIILKMNIADIDNSSEIEKTTDEAIAQPTQACDILVCSFKEDTKQEIIIVNMVDDVENKRNKRSISALEPDIDEELLVAKKIKDIGTVISEDVLQLDKCMKKNDENVQKNTNYNMSSNHFSKGKLITKAAQKYIPPDYTNTNNNPNLKCQLEIPEKILITLTKQTMKKDVFNKSGIKAESKVSSGNRDRIAPKKAKPNFEDVLKQIDKTNMYWSKKRVKRNFSSEKIVPKMIIKKNEHGSHYTSSQVKRTSAPDLTGNKWQPWVCLQRNVSIERMVKTKRWRALFVNYPPPSEACVSTNSIDSNVYNNTTAFNNRRKASCKNQPPKLHPSQDVDQYIL